MRRAGLGERGAQLLGADRLQQIGDGLGVEGLQRVFVERGGEDHRRRLGQRRQVARHLEPVDARHAHVEQHDVGRELVDHVDGLLAIAGFPGDFEFAGLRQHRTQAFARRRLVIDDEHAQVHFESALTGVAVNGKRSVTMYSIVETAGLHRGALAVHEIEPFLDVGERQAVAVAHGEIGGRHRVA